MNGLPSNNDNFLPDNAGPAEHCFYFEPYENNGGTLVAIAGADFATIACDTRLVDDYGICTREQNRLFQMGPTTVMGTCGCWCDALGILSVVESNVQGYELQHGKLMSTEAFAQMLSVSMYTRRFFPYCVSNVVAGIDKDGKGAVYSYDPLGHSERSPYHSAGSSSHIIIPAMDTLIVDLIDPVTIPYALEVTAHCFTAAGDVDVFTGDSAIINIITKDGIVTKKMPLTPD